MSRREFSRAERLALWRAWKAGCTLSQIAEGLNRRVCSVFQVLKRDGGSNLEPDVAKWGRVEVERLSLREGFSVMIQGGEAGPKRLLTPE
jgi:hypothetical protein